MFSGPHAQERADEYAEWKNNEHDLVTPEEVLESDHPLSLGDGDGSCPCTTIRGVGFRIHVHCWRVSCDEDCPHSGIHVTGVVEEPIRRKMAEHIKANNGWTESTDWSIVTHA